ncbi:TPA: hypothetical protein ACGQYV_005140, partial [Raoultella planticola]
MVDEYKTGDPVPSSAMPNVWDNNATIDNFVNSPELTVTTRTGLERDTMAGMQKKSDDQRDQMAVDGAAVIEETRQNLIPLSRQYMTLADAQADIANIPVGSTTYYRSPDNKALAIEVMNVAGTLTATGRQMDSSQTIFPGSRLGIIQPGKNKFDKSRVISGYYLFEGTGKPTANANYCYSDFIPVTAGRVYSSTPPQLPTSPARVTTFYDANNAYLSDISSVDSFTVPAGAAFVRVSILLTNLNTYQLSRGVGYSDYESYQDVIKPAVNLYPAIGFAAGKNLFDPDAVVNGVHISS